eukprot:CAMPEP_0201987506 /NCGR_PEP_ID=MMETSP0904-20121228/91837_1 /ASSEMBLY_ACC=CAM_ASM_000553 /TAXON_ID=420261 /ORGANISM="Thalassiosira antarctica, Strain CCMP982" /LENGTH=178 /DNA_ID=CAMNT_0048541627 /DNA_START=523 /DNA_END=1056 /DNA_ORIENTATION=+
MHRIPDLISGEVVSALALAVTSSPVEGPSNPFSIDDMPHNRDAASLWTKGQDPDGMGGATYYHTLCGMSRSGEAMLALALAVTSSPVEGPSNPFSIDDMPHNRDAASLWTKGQDPDGMGGATYYHTLCGMSRSGEAMLALALAVTSSPVEGPSNPFPLMICHTTGMRVVADEGTGSRW